MASGVYALEFEQICTVCYLPDCIEFDEVIDKRTVCPLRIVKRLGLTAGQGKALSQIAQARQYEPPHFLKMAEVQAERNKIVAA